jgi:hypothetical protein
VSSVARRPRERVEGQEDDSPGKSREVGGVDCHVTWGAWPALGAGRTVRLPILVVQFDRHTWEDLIGMMAQPPSSPLQHDVQIFNFSYCVGSAQAHLGEALDKSLAR